MLTLAQKKARKEGIGGSDSAALFEKCKYRSARDVYDDKLTPVEEEKEESTPQQLRGHKIEELLRVKYQQETGQEISLYKEDMPFVHPKFSRAIASVDGIIKSSGYIWEAKSHNMYSNIAKEYGEDGTDQIPENELIQVAQYSEIKATFMPIQGAIIDVAFVRDDSGTLESIERFGRYIYVYNPNLGRMIVEKAHVFYNDHVVPKRPPAGESKKKRIIPAESIKIATPEIVSVYKEANKIKEAIKKLQAEFDGKKDLLEQYLDDYQYLMDETNTQLAVKQLQTINYKAQEARVLTRPVFKLIGARDE